MDITGKVDIVKPGNNFWGPACQNDQHQRICACHETKCTGHCTVLQKHRIQNMQWLNH